MRNALIAIGVFIVSGFIVTQALAWNGNQHQGYGQMNGAMQGSGVHQQGWHQDQPRQSQAMRTGTMHQQGSHNAYQARGFGQQAHDSNARGYGNRGHNPGYAYGHGGNGYCR
ncbi:MAG: hypothetical protein U5L00_06435 [Desulfovermiculus sp.]|nr:hypothetical protein [Desulfovermiculus sp.]